MPLLPSMPICARAILGHWPTDGRPLPDRRAVASPTKLRVALRDEVGRGRCRRRPGADRGPAKAVLTR